MTTCKVLTFICIFFSILIIVGLLCSVFTILIKEERFRTLSVIVFYISSFLLVLTRIVLCIAFLVDSKFGKLNNYSRMITQYERLWIGYLQLGSLLDLRLRLQCS